MCEANVVEIAKFFTLFCEYLEWEYLTFGFMSGLDVRPSNFGRVHSTIPRLYSCKMAARVQNKNFAPCKV